MIADFAWQVLKISLSTSLLIGLLLLLIPVLQKRYRVKWRYAVWIIIAVRLLIPFNPALPKTPVKIELSERVTSIMLKYTAEPQETNQSKPETKNMDIQEGANYSSAIQQISASPMQIIGFVWLVGVLVFMFFQICSYQIFMRKLKHSNKENVQENIKEVIWQLGVGMGICRLPEPVITDVVDAPVLIGVLRPCILLPHVKYSAEDISFILRHELVHYLRKDMWYKLILMLANAVHWFNPLIYLMTAQAAKDIELACDEDVIREFDCDKRAKYGNTILASIPGKRRSEPMFSTNFGSSKQNIKSRLRNLFDMSAKRRGIAALCAVALCAVLIASSVTFSYAADKDDNIPTIEGEYTFSIPSLEAGEVVCIGKLEMNPSISYMSTLSVETGNGVFIAINESPGITKPNGTRWEQYYGTSSGSTVAISIEQTKTYYLYVGSPRYTLLANGMYGQSSKLTNITGELVAVEIEPISTATSAVSEKAADEAVSDVENEEMVFRLTNNGKKSIIQSSGFQAEAGQTLTITVQSNISGGTVDLFLFSPSGEEQRLTFSDSDTVKSVELTEGEWVYNCTGFFKSGGIVITGSVS